MSARAATLADSAIHDFVVARWLIADEAIAVQATIAVVGDCRTIPGPNINPPELSPRAAACGALGEAA